MAAIEVKGKQVAWLLPQELRERLKKQMERLQQRFPITSEEDFAIGLIDMALAAWEKEEENSKLVKLAASVKKPKSPWELPIKVDI